MMTCSCTVATDLETFARLASVAAWREVPIGKRFGENKVFIHHAWAMGRFDMTLDEFKASLWAAHQAGLLVLSRADLVEAMDAHDVRRSTLSAMGATFNFIRI